MCKQHAVIQHPYKQQNMLVLQLASYDFALRRPALSCGHVQCLKYALHLVTQLLDNEQWPVVLISQPAAAVALLAHGTTAGLGLLQQPVVSHAVCLTYRSYPQWPQQA